jgi:hypothetical protein
MHRHDACRIDRWLLSSFVDHRCLIINAAEQQYGSNSATALCKRS